MNKEEKKVSEPCVGSLQPWRKWGPYVSERSWGTVREDYDGEGDAWQSATFDLSRSKAYRWGEDGIAGICDRYQTLVFAPAFWNGKDAILKEKLFGLSSYEGNHGEDVKECYYHLDATPSHSYLKYLYKYPQNAFPYDNLREENKKRGSSDREYELVDTGIFNESRYFDIYIEYAKNTADDICIKIEAFNRGPEAAPLHILPHLWFRNQWSWTKEDKIRPTIKLDKNSLVADDSKMESPTDLPFDYHLGPRYFYFEEGAKVLFTENETGKKDAFHKAVIQGESLENSEGTKSALHYFSDIKSGSSAVLYFRLSDKELEKPFEEIEDIFKERIKDADVFYSDIHPKKASDEEKMIQRQALAGMIWSKQLYFIDVKKWMDGDDPERPPKKSREREKNKHWRHLNSMRILLMPDKWEYPWFAAWDHAFHCVSYGMVDIDFAKEQFWLLLFDQFQNPNGQIPAYEWDFSDLNPPVQGWALLQLYEMEKKKRGKGDRAFLEKCFHKLLINFAWWVNKVDSMGNNLFEGGFLGLDNITVVDRSQPFPHGGILQQSDGTGWMGMFCLNLMRIALELAKENSVYESLGTKFFQHFVYIAKSMRSMGKDQLQLWSETDGFFYDVLSYPDGRFSKFKVRSLVGIIPTFAVEILEEKELTALKSFHQDFSWFMSKRSDLTDECVHKVEDRFVLSLMNKHQLESIMRYAQDPEEFSSDFGLRSLSKYHEKKPFVFEEKSVQYEPFESVERVKGGNSNWRGPVWFPTNYLFIGALEQFSKGFGRKDFSSMADHFSEGLIRLFKNDKIGNRPIFGADFPFQKDPYWKDCLLFYEYYHPENGKGLGSSHQTGWTGLVANLIGRQRG